MKRMHSMKKTAFSLLLPLLAASAFLLLSSAPAAALTAESLQAYIEAARKLDLSDANLQLMNKNKEMTQDAHFMALLRAKLRLARLVKTAKYASGEAKRDSYLLRTQAGPLIAFLSQGGIPTPEQLVENAVEQIVKPLELQVLVRELPRYYEAVVNTPNWQKKFEKILSRRDRSSLEGGTLFHLSDFPEIGDKPYYTAALDVKLKDGSLFLYEFDAFIEGWLYSFWMRRWQDGTMEAVKMVLDWLNKALGQ